ncbi:head-tail connector protein [Paraurantiacibacter namhicola]|nr:phage head-tail connector protein [Paraurantiacibacter namhicola]
MNRTILVPPAPADAALRELKDWLAITNTAEDALLTGLIGAALEACEGFTGSLPLEATCEEILPAGGGWRGLTTRPVQAVLGMEGIPAEGSRFSFAPDAFEADLDAHGGAHVRIIRQGAAGRIAVRFIAGLAADWDSLPDALRHGVVRLAAELYRQRDESRASANPPSAVAALWRPWRRLRVA